MAKSLTNATPCSCCSKLIAKKSSKRKTCSPRCRSTLCFNSGKARKAKANKTP